MATFTGIPDSAIAHKKPITLQQGRALRDNPIAIAEGAKDAPRIQPKALADATLIMAPVSASAFAGATGLAGLKRVQLRARVATAGGAVSLRVAFSSDNGASWGTWQVLGSGLSGSEFSGWIDLVSRTSNVYLAKIDAVVDGPVAMTMPAGVNAMRFSAGAGSDPSFVVHLSVLEGRADV